MAIQSKYDFGVFNGLRLSEYNKIITARFACGCILSGRLDKDEVSIKIVEVGYMCQPYINGEGERVTYTGFAYEPLHPDLVACFVEEMKKIGRGVVCY